MTEKRTERDGRKRRKRGNRKRTETEIKRLCEEGKKNTESIERE
jgi:hypothetical protein